MRKEKEKKILPTLKFMLKTAVKNKPQLFIAYALQVVVSFSQTMVNIISSKYLVDEIAAIIGGGKAEEHIPYSDILHCAYSRCDLACGTYQLSCK